MRGQVKTGVQAGLGGLLSLVLLVGSALAEVERGQLTVRLQGFQSDAGKAVLSLVNAREQYLSRDHTPYRTAALEIRDRRAEWVAQDLPFGEYAITVYHDENGNGELDSNLFRIPREPYGFSHDARGSFGPPEYSEATFRLNNARRIVIITLK